MAQLPGQLAIAHVNGIDTGGTSLKQAVGEATGGSPYVSADRIDYREMEGIQGSLQFESSAAHVGRRLINCHLSIDRNLGPRLGGNLSIDANLSSQDQCLRLATIISQVTLYK